MRKTLFSCIFTLIATSTSANSVTAQKITDNLWYEVGLGYERVRIFNPIGRNRISDTNAVVTTLDFGSRKWQVNVSYSAMPGEVRGNIGLLKINSDIGRFKGIYLSSGLSGGWLEYRQNEYQIGDRSVGTRRRHGNIGALLGAGLGRYNASYIRLGTTLGYENNRYLADIKGNSFSLSEQIMKDSGAAIGLFGQSRLAISGRLVLRADMTWGKILRDPLFYTPRKSFNFSVGAMMLLGPKTRFGRPGIDASIRTDDRDSASNSGRRLRMKGLIRKEKK